MGRGFELAISAIGDGFTSLWNWLGDILESITDIPELVLDGIRNIFVPDIDVIKSEFDGLMSTLKSKLGVDVYDLDSLFITSSAPEDIEASYSVGLFSYSGKFVDFTWFIYAVERLRGYIRGFLVLLLLIFNVRQALSMFGLSSGEIASASDGGKK